MLSKEPEVFEMKNNLQKIIQEAKKRYSEDFWKYHIIPVVRNALSLTKEIPEANEQVVELASYLHDIARFQARGELSLMSNHHLVGAQMAGELLEKYSYDLDFISHVEDCIISHRGSKGPSPKDKEAEIVACADALSHFDTIFFVLNVFLQNDTFKESILRIEQKILRDWNRLTLPEAKELSRNKYEAVMLLIKSMKSYIQK